MVYYSRPVSALAHVKYIAIMALPFKMEIYLF